MIRLVEVFCATRRHQKTKKTKRRQRFAWLNDIPFRENAACASSVQCTYVCNVVYCCTVCCTSTAVLLYGAPPPPQCSYCSRHRLSGRRSYLHPQFTAQLVGACSYWHLGTEHVFLWPCAYYFYFLRLKFLTTKFLTGDAVCTDSKTPRLLNSLHRGREVHLD